MIILYQLGYAMTHCNEDSLMEVLPLYQNLEIHSKCKGVGVEWTAKSRGLSYPESNNNNNNNDTDNDVSQGLAKLYSLKDELRQSDPLVCLCISSFIIDSIHLPIT